MNHLQASKFICKILSYNIENREINKYKNIHWTKIIKIASGHLCLPALFYRIKEKKFLRILPNDLNSYLKEIYEINLNRNKKI